jgi:adenylate cyclase
MGVPLKAGEALVGALVFATRGDKAGVFTDPDLSLAMEMGTEVAFALERIQGARKEEAEQIQRDRFARHFPPAISEQLLGGSLVFAEAGETYPAVVLCARVIGAEAPDAAAPAVLFAALTAHAEQMADVAFAHAGMVLDNAGSRTLAIFGVPRARGDESWRALLAAQEMLERVQFMNELRIAEGKPSLELSVGLASGALVLGQVGERHRAQFGALGAPLDRAVLLASGAKHGELVADEPLAYELEARTGASAPGPLEGSRLLKRVGT